MSPKQSHCSNGESGLSLKLVSESVGLEPMRLFHSLACLFFAFGTIFSAWLAQGIIDGSIYVKPGQIGPYNMNSYEFMLAVCFVLTFANFSLFAIFGLLASDGRDKQCS